MTDMDYEYTDDPFAGDDDDLCYAEIIIPSDANTPQQQISPSGQRRASMTRHADPYAGYTTPNASEMLRDVAGRSQRGGSVASSRQAQRQQVNSQRMMATARSEEESVRASVAAADQQELAATYDDMLQSLRGEVDRLQEENNSLYSAQSKLESQMRKMTLEKEDMEWRYQQAQERNALLEERISAMEQDLAYAQGERREQRQLEAHQARAEGNATAAASRSGTRVAPSQHEQPPKAQAQPQQQPQPRSHEADVGMQAATATAHAQPAERVRAKPSPPPFATTPNASAPKRTAAQAAKLTERQKEQDYQSGVQSVEKLEAELLQHSQKRDELMGTIQRLERVRTIADRAKKAAAENDLEEEDRIIGHIRLQLRSKAFLHK